eukprot:SAG11_NODE_385_length_9888_cov_13.326387_6_plen_182_part_00
MLCALPTTALLAGPSGTGKTLLARAVAGECGLPFFSCSASDFVEVYVGLGASRVRQLFAAARKASLANGGKPAIVFIDEIDALGGARSGSFGGPGGGAPRSGANDEREQTLNALLTELDGFEAGKGVIMLAATNRPQMVREAAVAAPLRAGPLSAAAALRRFARAAPPAPRRPARPATLRL